MRGSSFWLVLFRFVSLLSKRGLVTASAAPFNLVRPSPVGLSNHIHPKVFPYQSICEERS